MGKMIKEEEWMIEEIEIRIIRDEKIMKGEDIGIEDRKRRGWNGKEKRKEIGMIIVVEKMIVIGEFEIGKKDEIKKEGKEILIGKKIVIGGIEESINMRIDRGEEKDEFRMSIEKKKVINVILRKGLKEKDWKKIGNIGKKGRNVEKRIKVD